LLPRCKMGSMNTEIEKPSNKDEDGYTIRPNKTVLKQENLELQAFILELSAMPTEARDALPIDEDCQHILGKIGRLDPCSARKRELRYATKFFIDWTPEKIQEYKVATLLATKRQIGQEKTVEKWRDRLLTDNDALTEFVAVHPETNVQQFRQLVRNAKKEAASGKPGTASNSLFKFIREAL
jgi:ribosome-associated protein